MMSVFARSPVGRTRDPEMCFLGLSRQDHTLQTILWTAGSFLSCDLLLGPEGRAGSWEAEESPQGKYAWMVRERKNRECLLHVSSMWRIRGVGTSLRGVISLAILCLLQAGAICRSVVSGGKTRLLLFHGKAYLSLFSFMTQFFSVNYLEYLIHF